MAKSNKIPHVWKTKAEGNTVYHLAMCKEGAIQAHLLHHGMMGCDDINIEDLGKLNPGGDDLDKYGKKLCIDLHCLLYGLAFDKGVA